MAWRAAWSVRRVSQHAWWCDWWVRLRLCLVRRLAGLGELDPAAKTQYAQLLPPEQAQAATLAGEALLLSR